MSEIEVFHTAPYIFRSRAVIKRDDSSQQKQKQKQNDRGKLTLKKPVYEYFQDLYTIEPHADSITDNASMRAFHIPSPSTPAPCEELPELVKTSAETTPGVMESEYTPQTMQSPDDPDDPDDPKHNMNKVHRPDDQPDIVSPNCQVIKHIEAESVFDSSDDALSSNEYQNFGPSRTMVYSNSLESEYDQVSDNEFEGCSDVLDECYSSNFNAQSRPIWNTQPLCPKRKLSPMTMVHKDLNSLKSGDAIFTVSLDQIFSKLVIALNDRESAYLFRDFAGNFCTFLDRFGPGGFDSHRAPPSASWMMKLVMPWLQINDEDATETDVSIYEEVSGWVCRITQLIGKDNWEVLLDEGPLDVCIEQIAYHNPTISDTAYKTIKTTVATFPIHYDLLCKILLIRNMSFGFESPEMVFLRHHRLKLLNQFVERIDIEKSRENQFQYMDLIETIIAELTNCASWETDEGVAKSISQSLDYSQTVLRSMEYLDIKDPFAGFNTLSRPPRLSQNVDRYRDNNSSKNESNETNSETGLQSMFQQPLSRRERIKSFLRRVFKWNKNTNESDLSHLDILTTKSMPAITSRFSVNSFRIQANDFCPRYDTSPANRFSYV